MTQNPLVTPRGFLLCLNQNHSPGIYWSRINTERDRSSPRPLNSVTVTNASMSATEVADARGRSLAMAALMSLSKFLMGQDRTLEFCLRSTNQVQPPGLNTWFAYHEVDPAFA